MGPKGSRPKAGRGGLKNRIYEMSRKSNLDVLGGPGGPFGMKIRAISKEFYFPSVGWCGGAARGRGLVKNSVLLKIRKKYSGRN